MVSFELLKIAALGLTALIHFLLKLMDELLSIRLFGLKLLVFPLQNL